MVDHRMFVAWQPDPWGGDRHGAEVLEILKRHGLKPEHRLLDFGCGSLRVGRWLIDYLDPDRYFGIEPETWLVEMAKLEEVPGDTWKAKRPTFDGNGDWNLDVFGLEFDYVVVSDVLLHAAHWQLDRVVRGMSAVLAPDGIGLGDILYVEERPEPHHEGDEWLYPNVALHYPDCLAAPAAVWGLKCEAVDVIGRSGLSLHWLKFTRQGGSSD